MAQRQRNRLLIDGLKVRILPGQQKVGAMEETSLEDIEYIPNLLDKKMQKNILSIVEDDDNFPWFYASSMVNGVNDNFGFAHNLLIDDKKSMYFDDFYPILEAFQDFTKKSIHYFFRVRIRMTLPRTGVNFLNAPHTDFDIPHYAFVYYINDSDGDTVFYDKFKGDDISDMKVAARFSPKMGDAVSFDGLRFHSGATPSKSRRIILNVDYL